MSACCPALKATRRRFRWRGSGTNEIRMHAAPPTGAVKQPLFIVDIFDHDAQRCIDSRACYTVAEGAVAFDEFLRTHDKPPV